MYAPPPPLPFGRSRGSVRKDVVFPKKGRIFRRPLPDLSSVFRDLARFGLVLPSN
jgi:hypothetical protein